MNVWKQMVAKDLEKEKASNALEIPATLRTARKEWTAQDNAELLGGADTDPEILTRMQDSLQKDKEKYEMAQKEKENTRGSRS